MVCLMVRWLFLGSLIFGIAHAAPLTFRAVAANLNSDNKQTYSPDNGNHSNREFAWAHLRLP